MVYNFHGLYIKLWRVVVFSVARMVLFPPVGIFPKIGWCSSSWFGVPRMGFVLFVPDRVVCPHAAVFCSRLLFSLPECSLPWCCHSCTGMTGRWYEIKRDEARWGEMRWTEMNLDLVTWSQWFHSTLFLVMVRCRLFLLLRRIRPNKAGDSS